jgi:nucleoside-diphosphate-sugar epimerase
MKALVTGSNGFIGSHLVQELVRRAWTVRSLVRSTSNRQALEGLAIEWAVGDTRDKESLRRAVRDVDYVFHLAGVIDAPDWMSYFEANTLGTRNLIEAIAEENPGLRKFVYVSSISAAGPSFCDRPGTEDDPCAPVSDYGRSKRLAEEAVFAAADILPVTIIRPANVLGPRQKELYQSIKLIRRRIMPLLGTGAPQTSLADVSDVVAALILAAERPESRGRVYLVTDGHAYAWRDITDAIADALGRKKFYVKVPYRLQFAAAGLIEFAARMKKMKPTLTRVNVAATRTACWIFDGSRIERELGFRPAMDMTASVRRTVGWYREKGLIS